MQLASHIQGGEPIQGMGTGSGYRLETRHRLPRSVADGDGPRRTRQRDRRGGPAGGPPDTVTLQEFQSIVRTVRRLKRVQSGCEDRLEQLEARQEGQVQYMYMMYNSPL